MTLLNFTFIGILSILENSIFLAGFDNGLDAIICHINVEIHTYHQPKILYHPPSASIACRAVEHKQEQRPSRHIAALMRSANILISSNEPLVNWSPRVFQ